MGRTQQTTASVSGSSADRFCQNHQQQFTSLPSIIKPINNLKPPFLTLITQFSVEQTMEEGLSRAELAILLIRVLL